MQCFYWSAKVEAAILWASCLRTLLSVLATLAFALAALPSHAQAPFVTDDTAVAGYHQWHFEFTNEYDILKESDRPNLRQNTANFKFSFGLLKNVEIGADNQILNISTAPNPIYPDAVFGYGDLDMSIKWHICDEKGARPSFGTSLNIEIPTGDERKQLGSGVADYYLNGILQKSLPGNNTLRVNTGIYFAGNTATGVVGIRTTRGVVFTSSASVTHNFSERFALGAEFAAARAWDLSFARGQLQTELGGTYALSQKLSITYGFIAGFYRDSPRFAPVFGFEKDF